MPRPAKPWPALALLFAGAALISGFTLLRGVDPFDEGLVLQAGRRVADGQIPYRDFLWAYGPAQPYGLAALFELHGVSLLDWRILRVLADAGVATLVWVIARREAGPRLALVGWLGAACIMAQPRSANPFPFALLAALGAVAAVTGGPPTRARIAGAAALTALAAAFRLDFALYGAAAVGVALALRGAPGRDRLRAVAGYAGAAAALGLAVYLPFLIAVGPADLYDALVGTSLREKEHWTLPFPLAYDGPFRLWPPGALLRDAKDVLDFYVPALLVAGLVAAAVATTLRARGERRPDPAWVALLVFGAGALAYLLSRTDEFHTTPLLVVLAALLPMAVARLRERWLVALSALLLALLVAHGAWNRVSALVRPPELATVDVPAADGVRAEPAEARALERVVALVQERVAPGEPIYVAPRRSDLVRFNNPLVYVLTERDNPTRRDFGLETSAAAQREIVATLERTRPELVVRWTAPISAEREPNLRGRSSGVRLLDDYLGRTYRPLERAGDYVVLVRR